MADFALLYRNICWTAKSQKVGRQHLPRIWVNKLQRLSLSTKALHFFIRKYNTRHTVSAIPDVVCRETIRLAESIAKAGHTFASFYKKHSRMGVCPPTYPHSHPNRCAETAPKPMSNHSQMCWSIAPSSAVGLHLLPWKLVPCERMPLQAEKKAAHRPSFCHMFANL